MGSKILYEVSISLKKANSEILSVMFCDIEEILYNHGLDKQFDFLFYGHDDTDLWVNCHGNITSKTGENLNHALAEYLEKHKEKIFIFEVRILDLEYDGNKLTEISQLYE